MTIIIAVVLIFVILGLGHSPYGTGFPTYPSIGGVLLLLLVLYFLGYIH